jgi:hypothetical protein
VLFFQIAERTTHVVGGSRDVTNRIQDRALEIAEACKAQGLDRPHHGGVGRAGTVAERRRRTRQYDLTIFTDESRDAATGGAKLLIGAAQELIQVTAKLGRELVCHSQPSSSPRDETAEKCLA